MVIVYRSNTGFTQQYAQMLAKAEKLKCLALPQAAEQLEHGTQVFFLGPVTAGHIGGVDQAVKQFSVRGVCAVGMTPPGMISPAALAKSNFVPDAPIFYLQGGWAPKKVSWLKRRMVNMATKSIREPLEAKGKGRTPEENRQLDMLLHGGSFVAYENLEPIREWLKGQL